MVQVIFIGHGLGVNHHVRVLCIIVVHQRLEGPIMRLLLLLFLHPQLMCLLLYQIQGHSTQERRDASQLVHPMVERLFVLLHILLASGSDQLHRSLVVLTRCKHKRLLLLCIVDRNQFYPSVVQKIDLVAQKRPNRIQEFVSLECPRLLTGKYIKRMLIVCTGQIQARERLKTNNQSITCLRRLERLSLSANSSCNRLKSPRRRL